MRGAADGHDGAVGDAAFVLALREKGLRDTTVLRAMEQVSRADFAPSEHRALARRDIALPLPCGASMTAPSTVAAMLSLAQVEPGQPILEIGSGSGYVTALLAHLGAGSVLGLERYAGLACTAQERLCDHANVRVDQGDGLADALGQGRFARILVHGSVPALPPHWIAALAPGGRLVAGLSRGGACRIAVLTRGAGEPHGQVGPAVRLAPLIAGRALAS